MVLSSSLALDTDLPLFAEQRPGDDPPLILTGTKAASVAATRLRSVAEVVRLASPRPSPAEILTELERRGARVVLSEGGASFNAQLADAGVIDELCLSVAPLLVGGTGPRIVEGSRRQSPLRLRLDHLLEASETLFARYLVGASSGGAARVSDLLGCRLRGARRCPRVGLAERHMLGSSDH